MILPIICAGILCAQVTKNIDNVVLLGMAGEIAKKHMNKGINN